MSVSIRWQPEKKPSKKRGPSKLGIKFKRIWNELGGPDLTPELRFHPDRMFRFDFAHEPTRTAIEIDGGLFIRGRHQRPSGVLSDNEKINSALTMGWHVFRLTSKTITVDELTRIIQHIAKTPAVNAPVLFQGGNDGN
jgi:very-short-patch-repair endonuclease